MRSARQKLGPWLTAFASALVALAATRTVRAEEVGTMADKPAEVPRYDLGLRLELGGLIAGQDLNQAPLGAALDAGTRISPRWYLGGVSGVDMYVSDLFGSGGTFTSRFQAGAEARYLFSRGHGSMRVNGGPRQVIPSLGWLSLSAGYETFGFVFGKASGTFANVGYLSELYAGEHFNLGMVFTLGGTYDAPRVYGEGSLFHGTADFAFRFAWGL